ncbi:MAG TPA: nitrate/nitrite transporter NrtS [Leptolyngbyaceae cyanobacterium]
MKGYLLALLDPEFRPSALRVALLVGTLLFSINHGAALITGSMTTSRWLSGLLTYIVPYCVNVQGRYAARCQNFPKVEEPIALTVKSGSARG